MAQPSRICKEHYALSQLTRIPPIRYVPVPKVGRGRPRRGESPVFTIFGKFPPEIQDAIWEWAVILNDSIVHENTLHIKKFGDEATVGNRTWHTPTMENVCLLSSKKGSALLYTCKNSRKSAEKILKPLTPLPPVNLRSSYWNIHGPTLANSMLMISPSQTLSMSRKFLSNFLDIVHYTDVPTEYVVTSLPDFKTIFNKVERISLQLPLGDLAGQHLPQVFPNLKRLTFRMIKNTLLNQVHLEDPHFLVSTESAIVHWARAYPVWRPEIVWLPACKGCGGSSCMTPNTSIIPESGE